MTSAGGRSALPPPRKEDGRVTIHATAPASLASGWALTGAPWQCSLRRSARGPRLVALAAAAAHAHCPTRSFAAASLASGRPCSAHPGSAPYTVLCSQASARGPCRFRSARSLLDSVLHHRVSCFGADLVRRTLAVLVTSLCAWDSARGPCRCRSARSLLDSVLCCRVSCFRAVHTALSRARYGALLVGLGS